eukprot:CAMPEP_0181414422 /NCGR_PEP_ID=MMETSP1110-20121109/9500_1 /TAXON_ID=174948 /ORGANISM="Symbiodinium sp., Strain CCMP421" /LENGTH=54 /DNA_ID=CAMNT_0023537307 /DNA_START=188 /DNA_END=348 /DNA_ORIENTATION=+
MGELPMFCCTRRATSASLASRSAAAALAALPKGPRPQRSRAPSALTSSSFGAFA